MWVSSPYLAEDIEQGMDVKPSNLAQLRRFCLNSSELMVQDINTLLPHMKSLESFYPNLEFATLP